MGRSNRGTGTAGPKRHYSGSNENKASNSQGSEKKDKSK